MDIQKLEESCNINQSKIQEISRDVFCLIADWRYFYYSTDIGFSQYKCLGSRKDIRYQETLYNSFDSKGFTYL